MKPGGPAHKLFPKTGGMCRNKITTLTAIKSAPGALGRSLGLIPGIALCGAITAVSLGAQLVEERVFAHPYVEALVIAILLGMAIRTAWQPSERWRSGIAFSAKQLLEVAVMLLGASVSFAAIVGVRLSPGRGDRRHRHRHAGGHLRPQPDARPADQSCRS